MVVMIRSLSQTCTLVVILATPLTRAAAGEPALVGFDAPATVVAEPVNPLVVESPTMGGELMRLRIPVSTFLSTEFRGTVREYVVEIESPYQSMRIVDFWPREEVYSNIEGNVSVESSQQSDRSFQVKVSGSMEPFARADTSANFHKKSNVQERYQRKPPMQILTSSGTIRRGFGVFFKFRPGPLPSLEGAREVAILAEVPQGWRADMLQISMRAVGSRSGSLNSRARQLGASRLWVTTHREGDAAAAAQTRRYVSQERSLRALAALMQKKIADKSSPTFWHRVGVALDVVDPKIPGDYLAQIIFGPQNEVFSRSANRLPVDLRVAVLDYWDQRNSLMKLAYPHPAPSALVATSTATND